MAHTWAPVTDLPKDWETLSDQQVRSVVQLWKDRAELLRDTEIYKDFLIKLRRQWAIETGVLERLYTISEGATKTLIEQGLDAALLTHGDTDRPPREVLALIKDQHTVIEGLYQFVHGVRGLSKSYFKELHQALTTHQMTYDATNSLGQFVTAPMVRGEWKKLPNNVELEDGSFFEFTPPEQVDSELDRLLTLHHQHESDGVSPDVESAWLHHRFTLIHPFVDGNGRVARSLATLILLKADWFPLVVTRDDKPAYLKAIRTADDGDLAPLVVFFGELQRRAVRQALSLSEEVERESKAIRSILSTVSDRISRRRHALQSAYRRAVTTADALHVLTRERMREVADEVKAVVTQDKEDYEALVRFALRDEQRAEFNRWQIVGAAKQLDYFANVTTFPSWVELQIETSSWVGILVAFHGIGREWLGLLGAVGMAYRKEQSEDGRLEVVELKPLCTAPFEIAYSDEPIALEQRYRKWLEDVLILGLDFWQQFV